MKEPKPRKGHMQYRLVYGGPLRYGQKRSIVYRSLDEVKKQHARGREIVAMFAAKVEDEVTVTMEYIEWLEAYRG